MRANMQYNETLVKLAKTFLANENVEVYFDEARTEFSICVDVHNNRIWTDGNRGLWSTVAKGVKVRHANFLVTYDEEDDYWSGGLAGTVHYDGSGEDGTWYDGSDVEQNVLINKVKDMRESDGMIYTDTAFLDNLKKYMVESCDYDMRLEEYLDFDYSEQGMQDDEYVNLDVELDGTFWLYVIDEMQKEGIAHRRIGEEDIVTEAVA
tara:strand:+ start:82 stop:702 length:621 start_codon:yes stop_codon:yes gene_type:complete